MLPVHLSKSLVTKFHGMGIISGGEPQEGPWILSVTPHFDMSFIQHNWKSQINGLRLTFTSSDRLDSDGSHMNAQVGNVDSWLSSRFNLLRLAITFKTLSRNTASLLFSSFSSFKLCHSPHYNDVIMGALAHQITSLTIVYSIVYSDADQRKHQSSASLAFVRGPVNSPHKWPVMRKMFPFDDVIMVLQCWG